MQPIPGNGDWFFRALKGSGNARDVLRVVPAVLDQTLDDLPPGGSEDDQIGSSPMSRPGDHQAWREQTAATVSNGSRSGGRSCTTGDPPYPLSAERWEAETNLAAGACTALMDMAERFAHRREHGLDVEQLHAWKQAFESMDVAGAPAGRTELAAVPKHNRRFRTATSLGFNWTTARLYIIYIMRNRSFPCPRARGPLNIGS